jgi:predicted GNAT superfamily acetyltransferase
MITERLQDPHAFSTCEAIQQEITGIVRIPTSIMVDIEQSGGLIIGARENEVEGSTLAGALIDLVGESQGCRSWFTLFHGVRKELQNQGIGHHLRLRERMEGKREGIALVTWAIDPLESKLPHLAFNKLAAIAVSYKRNMYGEATAPDHRGLATRSLATSGLAMHGLATRSLASDRLIVEWWLDSPRVSGVINRRRLPHHFHLGLDKMEVVTKTRLVQNGIRRLVSYEETPKGKVILVEIPADLDRLCDEDLNLARDWRLKTRNLFERLLTNGYTMTGFVHEASRSFHLLERADRKTILGRSN